MHILCLGLNHQTASISLRGHLAFTDDVARAALSRLGCGEQEAPAEMVILSTCNRIEIYAVSSHVNFHTLEEFLSDTRGIPANEFLPHIYRYTDKQSVHHLLDVAAGLDSLILGEPQILGQVTKALELARGQNAAGPVLNRLFQTAIHAGKRTRTETTISRNPSSVSSLAASLCEHTVNNISAAHVVIVGAGEMAELAVEALRKRGVERIMVINRTLDRARKLAERWDAEALTFESLENAVARADILIASTSAPHTIIQAGMVARVMETRISRPLTLIDIAVPRDIDPETANIPGVALYDIDHLNAQLECSLEERRREVPLVQTILAEEETGFMNFFKSLDMLPLITDLRQQAESIRQSELQKTFRRLPNLTEKERESVEALTEALVKKLLDSPTQRLRAEATSPRALEYAALTRSLFNLTHESHPSYFAADEPTTRY